MPAAAYSVAHMTDGRDRGCLVYVYAWACWTSPPTGRPWTTPLSTGQVLQSGYESGHPRAHEQAEIDADDALRARLGEGIETRRVDDSFARAAFREARGAAPNWRAPRPPKRRSAIPRGFSRPWAMPAREYFGRLWLGDDVASAEMRERLRDLASGRLSVAAVAPALAALGLGSSATEADVRRAYRRLALELHPDRGGSFAAFVELSRARDCALAAVRA